MTAYVISVAKDFSPSPAGRYMSDGPYAGEVFRDKLLVPALKEHDKVIVDLDGTDGFGSSFLEEAFGGLIRRGFKKEKLEKDLDIRSSRETYKMRAWNYIRNERH